MNTVKYAIMDGEQILRCIQLSQVNQELASAKIKHLYKNKSCFCKAELISEKLYQIYKKMGVKG